MATDIKKKRKIKVKALDKLKEDIASSIEQEDQQAIISAIIAAEEIDLTDPDCLVLKFEIEDGKKALKELQARTELDEAMNSGDLEQFNLVLQKTSELARESDSDILKEACKKAQKDFRIKKREVRDGVKKMVNSAIKSHDLQGLDDALKKARIVANDPKVQKALSKAQEAQVEIEKQEQIKASILSGELKSAKAKRSKSPRRPPKSPRKLANESTISDKKEPPKVSTSVLDSILKLGMIAKLSPITTLAQPSPAAELPLAADSNPTPPSTFNQNGQWQRYLSAGIPSSFTHWPCPLWPTSIKNSYVGYCYYTAKAVNDLQTLTQGDEPWDNDISFLNSFLDLSFRRLQVEERNNPNAQTESKVFGYFSPDESDPLLICFNTGLRSSETKEAQFALITRPKPQDSPKAVWHLLTFMSEEQLKNEYTMQAQINSHPILNPPPPVSFITSGRFFVYDSHLPIFNDGSSLISSTPIDLVNKSGDIGENIKTALKISIEEIRYNMRAAVPATLPIEESLTHYSGGIVLLIPCRFDYVHEDASACFVMERENMPNSDPDLECYYIRRIISLKKGRLYARLVARIDQHWLLPPAVSTSLDNIMFPSPLDKM